MTTAHPFTLSPAWRDVTVYSEPLTRPHPDGVLPIKTDMTAEEARELEAYTDEIGSPYDLVRTMYLISRALWGSDR
jgi:hypothetical protein